MPNSVSIFSCCWCHLLQMPCPGTRSDGGNGPWFLLRILLRGNSSGDCTPQSGRFPTIFLQGEDASHCSDITVSHLLLMIQSLILYLHYSSTKWQQPRMKPIVQDGCTDHNRTKSWHKDPGHQTGTRKAKENTFH